MDMDTDMDMGHHHRRRQHYPPTNHDRNHNHNHNHNHNLAKSARYVLDRSVLPTRASYGVPEDRFVLCNFNQLYKMDPSIFSTWMSVLKRVPNAVLWLLRFPPAGEANIRMEARKRGVRDEQVREKESELQSVTMMMMVVVSGSWRLSWLLCRAVASGHARVRVIGEGRCKAFCESAGTRGRLFFLLCLLFKSCCA